MEDVKPARRKKVIEAEYDPVTVYTLEGASVETLREAAKMTLVEKIQWLEKAQKKFEEDQEERRKQGLKPIVLGAEIES